MKTMPYNLVSTTTSISTALSQAKSLTALYDKASSSLASGKTVNSSYDNPALFFKDMRLNEHAKELQNIIDGLSIAVSTLNATDSSIDAVSDLLSHAKAIVSSALDGQDHRSILTGDCFTTSGQEKLSCLPNIKSGDEILIRTGDADKMVSSFAIDQKTTLADLNILENEELKIKIADNEWCTLTVIDENMTVNDFFAQITNQAGLENFTYDITNRHLTISTTDNSAIMLSGNLAEALGFDLSETYKITIQENWTVDDLAKAFSDLEDFCAYVNSRGYFEVSSINTQDLIIADLTGNSAQSFGINSTAGHTGQTYTEQYNEILIQIDNIIADSSFNGVNLLQGDTIKVVFDEKAENYRTITGRNLDSSSLGLYPADLTDKENIQNVLEALDLANDQVKQSASAFDRFSYMIQSRETFLDALSNTCSTGAELLTGADLNEISAEILAVETQKQLVNSVISITLEANSSVLSLF